MGMTVSPDMLMYPFSSEIESVMSAKPHLNVWLIQNSFNRSSAFKPSPISSHPTNGSGN